MAVGIVITRKDESAEALRRMAEGIETPEQLARLRAEGCTEVQGYLISRPKPAFDLPTMLAREGGWTQTHSSGICQGA